MDIEKRAKTVFQIERMRDRGMDAPTIAGKLQCGIQPIEIIFDELDIRNGVVPFPDGYKYSTLTDNVYSVLEDIRTANDNSEERRKEAKIRVQQMGAGMLMVGENGRKYSIAPNEDDELLCTFWSPPPLRGAPITRMDIDGITEWIEELREVRKNMRTRG